MTLIYFVTGMFCGSCARTVEKGVRALPGVAGAGLNFSNRLLRVELRSGTEPEELSREIENAIRQGGFEAKRQSGGWLPEFLDQLRDEQSRAIPPWLLCFVFFFAMWSSTMAFAGYLGGVSNQERWLLAALSTALGMPALLLGSAPFAKAGLRSLRRAGMLTLDLFIGFGGGCAALFSLNNLAAGSSETYVDSAAMVLTLLLGAKIAETRLARRMAQGILNSIHGQDLVVTRIEPGPKRLCLASQIRRLDVVLFRTGETVLFDGPLLNGQAAIDNHLLSGEPTDRKVNRGEVISAGSIARSDLTLRVDHPVGSRMVDIWAETALTAASRPHRYSNSLVQMESWLTLVALCGSSCLGILSYLRTARVDQGVEAFFIGVLIFCPCLFANILPYAKQLAHLSLARQGIICHRVDCLFDLHLVRHLVFDKTGTLEALESTLILRDQAQHLDAKLPSLLDSLRRHTPHPILDGLVLAEGRDTALPAPSSTQVTPGQGVMASWPELGETLVAGRASFVSAECGGNAEGPRHATWVARNGQVVAEIVPSAVHQQHALEMLRRLHQERPDLSLHILSGDPRPLTGPLRDLVSDGIVSYHGNLSPDQKSALMPISSAFVGDGLNDILALARADVSIRTGARGRAFGTVDIELCERNLEAVPQLLRTSRRFVTILGQTAAMAVVYNVIAWLLAALGMFSPLGAVCAMLSSLTLMTLSSLRLLRKCVCQSSPSHAK